MKTKFLVATFLLSTCLTSWAWFPKSVTPEKVSQIHIGRTSEAELVNLFGPPTTRFVDITHTVSLDWFRSVPMSPAGYLPLVGELLGGLDVEARQLSVVLGPSGRVIRFELHSSKEKPRGDGLRTTTVRTTASAH